MSTRLRIPAIYVTAAASIETQFALTQMRVDYIC